MPLICALHGPRMHDTGLRGKACIPVGLGRRLTIAEGHGAQGYTLALEVALEHLSLAEVGTHVHAVA